MMGQESGVGAKIFFSKRAYSLKHGRAVTVGDRVWMDS